MQQKIPIDGVAFLLGRRIAALLVPVFACMLLVSWSVLNLSSLIADQQFSPIFSFMDEEAHDTIRSKIGSSIVNALILVAMLTVMTFLMVLLYACHCEKVLFAVLFFSAGFTLFFMTWMWMDLFCTRFQIPYDFITSSFLLWNAGIVGLVSIFYYAHPVLAQVYLVVVSVIVGWSMTFFSEWSTWSMLVFVALYDMVAVLSPRGPLKMLIQIAEKRNEPLPGFVYNSNANPSMQKAERVGVPPGEDMHTRDGPRENNSSNDADSKTSSQMTSVPRLYYALDRSPFKLGLGDFIFYSVLSARAALYAFMPWAASTVAVCFGLVATLTMLLMYKSRFPALPALPISICFGVAVFFLYRFVVTPLDYFAALSVLAL
ncbi:putative presenilin-like aspartic peptidase [Trypanosoma cruzi]|uniref:Presenilin n=2 Tax=Trypanosoma cruzi TaxID=5693 RepID=Q4CMV5_TRYCC|nr:presenilin-like aspartic peptidase, putative [Trypanosoma cruzi]EAN81606.1 presenilin-like aspartic peptidase, putative [Trypanosoma cruzi]PWV04196.1 putative presenilin-like aspartic peptidase [Trypanosoma cruzi]|eukprot:XP_803052.1 presenilin-like aspartic peptidase [Trypanosoma cruzi strain CL Brener]